MKTFSIVIPRYSEGDLDIFPLLASIGNQVGIDLDSIEVLVVSDKGAVPLTDVFVDCAKTLTGLDIQLFELKEHGGPGMARQKGIDEAHGKWIMCCDADDCLHNVGVLGALLEIGENEGADIVTSSWLEEGVDPNTGKMVYISHDMDMTWMHGKLLRRSFLEENEIRHHPDLQVHEDTYFLSIVANLTEKRFHLPNVTYIWRFGEDSITRRDDAAYRWNSLPTFVDSAVWAMDELERRGIRECLTYKTVQLIFYMYYTLHSKEWEDHQDYLSETESHVAAGFGKYMALYREADPELIGTTAADERAKHFNGTVESETVEGWFERIGLIKQE